MNRGTRGSGGGRGGGRGRGRPRGAVSANARNMNIRIAVASARANPAVAGQARAIRNQVLPALGFSVEGGRYALNRLRGASQRATILNVAEQLSDPALIGSLKRRLNRKMTTQWKTDSWSSSKLHPATAVVVLRDYALKTDTEAYPYGITMTISGTTATGDTIYQSRIVDAWFLERSDAILQALLSGHIVDMDDIDSRDSDTELINLLGAVNLKVKFSRQRLDARDEDEDSETEDETDDDEPMAPPSASSSAARRGRPRGASTESGGSFWSYWVDERFPQDLSFLQVYKKSQRDDLRKKLMDGEALGDETYELDCFGSALLYLECPKETLLRYYEIVAAGFGDGDANTTLFSGASSGWLPTDKIKKVAELLKINVCLTYYDKSHQHTTSNIKTWQGDEESSKWYPIGRLAGHYFPDVESPWTFWAASHLKQMLDRMESGELKKYDDEPTKLYDAVGYRENKWKPGQQLLKHNSLTGKISYGRLLAVLLYGVSPEVTSSGVKRKREDYSKAQEPLMTPIEPDDYILSTNLHHMFRSAMSERNLPEFWNDGNFEEVLKHGAKPKDRSVQNFLRPRSAIVKFCPAMINSAPHAHLTERGDVSVRLNKTQLQPLESEELQAQYDERGIEPGVSKYAFWDHFTRLVKVTNIKKETEIVHVKEAFTIVAFDFETDTTTGEQHTAYMCSVAYYVYAHDYPEQGYSKNQPYDYRDLDLGIVKADEETVIDGASGERTEIQRTAEEKYATPLRFGQSRAKLVKKTFVTSVDEHGTMQHCAEQLHDFLNGAFDGYHVLAIAHNLRYDLNLFMKNSKAVMVESITKSTSKTNTAKAYLNNGRGLCIHFLDSYALISHALSKFGKMFDLGECKKEIMPYRAYTIPRLLSNPFMRYDEVEEFLQPGDKLEDFIKLVETEAKAKVESQEEGMFNMWKYAQFYCERDCEVLLRGFNVNRAVLYNLPYSLEEGDGSKCKLDVVFATSSAQYASSFASVAGCYDETYVFSGTLREYMQRAVVGGRVMVSQNIPHHCTDVVNDFDAVSLYPSAMFRLKDEIGGFPKGKPKLWTPAVDLTAPDIVTYYITVKITKVKIHLQFPILSLIDEDGGRHFTNDLVGCQIVVDRVTWEDAQRHQGIEGDIICGVYFDSGVNSKIAEVIRSLKLKRDELKKRNPVTGKIKDEAGQESVKLIMNSIYGRTIMKPIDKKMEYKCGSHDEIMRFIYKHSVSICEYYFVRPDFCVIYRHQPIVDHWSAPHIGALILSMSKRIMNEVIVLAETIDTRIHYQDTDSMHVNDEDLPSLEASFKSLYGRELVGKELGQFHCDFTEVSGYKDAVSIESVYVGKKMYVDKLKYVKKDNPEEVLYNSHIRLKGIPRNVIMKEVEDMGKRDAMAGLSKKNDADYCIDLYKNLLVGGEIEFDLTGAGGCLFEGSKEMVTRNKTKFTRKVKLNKMQKERALQEAEKFPPTYVASLDDGWIVPNVHEIWKKLWATTE